MGRVRLQAIAIAAAVVFLLSCSTAPRWRYDSTGAVHEYKRYPRNIQVDYFTRFRRTAYKPVTKPIDEFLSDEQRRFISRYGQPDYRRRPFRSRLNEDVDEWIYLEQNKLVQFVKGHVVYQGEITDMERIMIRLGYPRRVIIAQNEPDTERFTFIYSRPWDLEREVFSFANGKLIFRQIMR